MDPAGDTRDDLAELARIKAARGAAVPPPPPRRAAPPPETVAPTPAPPVAPTPTTTPTTTAPAATTDDNTANNTNTTAAAPEPAPLPKPPAVVRPVLEPEPTTPLGVAKPTIRHRNTTADLPQSLLDELQLHVLTEAASGRRFVITARVEAALRDLPMNATSLVKLLERHRHRLNWELKPSDPEYRAAGRFAIRLPESTIQRLAQLQLELHRHGRSATRQDLVGLSIINAISN